MAFTPTAEVLREKQISLSQISQILGHYGYRDKKPPRMRNWNPSQKSSKKELEMLQTIAACLTSGEQGEVIAAVFDQGPPITVFLSKNGPVTETDTKNASNFFTALLDPQCTVDRLVKVFAYYSRRTMMKRISKMSDGLDGVWEYLRQRINDYKAKPHFKEFHWSYLQSIGAKSVHDILRRSLKKLRSLAATLRVTSIPEALGEFVSASRYASFFVETTFMKSMIGSPNCPPSLAKFHRRLDKLALYTRGIEQLIANREGLGGNLGVVWAVEPDGVDDAPAVELAQTALGAACQIMHIEYPSELFYQKYPPHQWITRVNPSYHAEVWLVLFMDSKPPRMPRGTARDRSIIIGCSKRSCICCAYWVAEYASMWKTKWLLPEFNKKFAMEWRLPPKTAALVLFVALYMGMEAVLACMPQSA